jgi:hypothetical protein
MDGELCPIRVPLSGLTRPGIRLLAAPKISPGCAHCYAETITLRFKRGGPFLPGKTTIKLHPDHLDAPGKWRAPKLVFVNSMSDLFHEEVPFEFISQVFDRMSDYSQHTYQVLTKRPERMMDYVRWSGNKRWPDHVWAGDVCGESALGGPTHAIASRGAVLHSVPVLRAAAQAAEPGSGRHKLGDRWGAKAGTGPGRWKRRGR